MMQDAVSDFLVQDTFVLEKTCDDEERLLFNYALLNEDIDGFVLSEN